METINLPDRSYSVYFPSLAYPLISLVVCGDSSTIRTGLLYVEFFFLCCVYLWPEIYFPWNIWVGQTLFNHPTFQKKMVLLVQHMQEPVCGTEMGEKEKLTSLHTMKRGRTGDKSGKE